MRLMYDDLKAAGIEITFPEIGLVGKYQLPIIRKQVSSKYESLLKQKAAFTQEALDLLRQLGVPDLTVVRADNVRAYISEQPIWSHFLKDKLSLHSGNPKYFTDTEQSRMSKQILSLALRLPFKAMWIEYMTKSEDIPNHHPFVSPIDKIGFSISEMPIVVPATGEFLFYEVHFQMWVSAWGKPYPEPVMSWYFSVDELGKFVAEMAFLDGDPCEFLKRTDSSARRYFARQILVALYAVTFMSCRNVELIDNEPKPLTKKQKRRGDPEHVAYKTIKVLPMRKVYQNANQPIDDSMPEPSTEPLHICRGHFKDFRNGNGLFGKFKDVFWWEQHVRGNAENGTIIKDYEVEAPKSA